MRIEGGVRESEKRGVSKSENGGSMSSLSKMRLQSQQIIKVAK